MVTHDAETYVGQIVLSAGLEHAFGAPLAFYKGDTHMLYVKFLGTGFLISALISVEKYGSFCYRAITTSPTGKRRTLGYVFAPSPCLPIRRWSAD